MRLAVIVVNYRTADLTVNCLRSIAEDGWLSRNGGRVFVVDNASGDDSCTVIAQAIEENGWNGWVELLAAERNGGFAYGNNVGISRALAEGEEVTYVLLLNPDTLVRPGAIETLVRFMDDHPSVGIAGSGIINPDGTRRRTAFRYHSIGTEFVGMLRFGPVSRLLPWCVVAPEPPDTACRVDWVSGAAMIVRREVFETVGLMDEDYFLYFEETDFCLQAERKGWECWYVPSARVVHLVGQSTQVTSKDASLRRRPEYWFDSRRRYFAKNHGRVYLYGANLAWLAGAVLSRLRQIVLRKANPDPRQLRRDFVRHWLLGDGRGNNGCS